MPQEIKVGACLGVNQLQEFVDYGLGNYVYLHLPGVHHIMYDGPEIKETPEQLDEYRRISIEAAAFLCKHKIYFTLAEIRNRRRLVAYSPYRPKDFQAIAKAGGKYFLGRFVLGESGGTVYWPKEYLKDSPLGADMNFPDAANMQEAKNHYTNRIKKALKMEIKLTGKPWWMVCSSMLQKYHLESGINVPVLETFPGLCDLLYSSARGASRGYGKNRWGSHIAMTWYGGCAMDTLWFKRWKASLYTSYIAGAEYIYSEHGHLGNFSLTNKYSTDSKESAQYRKILKEFYAFCQKNPRPNKGPIVKVGILHGNLDGNGGLWNKWVWGQYKGEHWKHGGAENGLNSFADFYHKTDWNTSTLTGEMDTTGNPPNGQMDILPIESPQSVLNTYSCLVLMGWNTCTPEIYKKLKAYVHQGGHLWLSIAHLNTETARNQPWKLINHGNWKDFLGVQVIGQGKTVHSGIKFIDKSSLPQYSFPSWGLKCDPKFIGNDIPLAKIKLAGAHVLAVNSATHHLFEIEKEGDPVLVENLYGKGHVFLMTTWCYPGAPGLAPFVKDMVRAIVQAEQSDLRVITSDRMRYGVYQENQKQVIYFYNTDYDNSQTAKIYQNQKLLKEITVKANQISIYTAPMRAKKR